MVRKVGEFGTKHHLIKLGFSAHNSKISKQITSIQRSIFLSKFHLQHFNRFSHKSGPKRICHTMIFKQTFPSIISFLRLGSTEEQKNQSTNRDQCQYGKTEWIVNIQHDQKKKRIQIITTSKTLDTNRLYIT